MTHNYGWQQELSEDVSRMPIKAIQREKLSLSIKNQQAQLKIKTDFFFPHNNTQDDCLHMIQFIFQGKLIFLFNAISQVDLEFLKITV